MADAVADVETLPMGVAGEPDSTTYCDADKLHPNGAGHAALATLIGAAVDSLG